MSTTPPIQYSGPTISPEVPWETRRHLQLIYQKLGNHTQAFSLQQQTIAKLKAGASTSTSAVSAGSSSAVTPQAVTSALNAAGYILPQGVAAVNNQTGQTTYATQPGDYASLVTFSDSSAIAVSLTTQTPPWSVFMANIGAPGAGTVTLTPFIWDD